jgi:hypothetical protein
MTTAEEKAFISVAVTAIPRVAEIILEFPPDDRAGALETAERRFLAAALDYGCTEMAARSRVSVGTASSRLRTTMLPFKVKGGSNRNSAIALSCCWYGPASWQEANRVQTNLLRPIVSRQRPIPLHSNSPTLTASSAISTPGLIRIWRTFAIQELLPDRIPLPCLGQWAGACFQLWPLRESI